MKKVRFIYNPSAGETLITELLDNIVAIYQERGYLLQLYRLGFAEKEEDDMLDGVDKTFHHILIAGGDGTVNYVVNAMKRMKIDVPVALLPSGTANDFAYALGIPNDIPKACRSILSGEFRDLDLGCVNDEYFVNVFSCGLFTDVSQKTPTFLKNTFGKLAYYIEGIGELPNFRKMNVSIETEHGKYEGASLLFFVFNGRTAGKMRFAYLSKMDDGLLDVLVVKGDTPVNTLQAIFHFIRTNTGLNRKKETYPTGVVHIQSNVVTIRSYNEETTDIDGQAGPRLPVKITCEAGGLRVLCPKAKK